MKGNEMKKNPKEALAAVLMLAVMAVGLPIVPIAILEPAAEVAS